MLDSITVKVLARQALEIALIMFWTLSLDGWTDISGNSVYAVLLICGTQQHYIGNLEIDLKRHTSDNILAALEYILGDHIIRIRAIVTDSPNVMKKLRADFCEKYSWVHNLGCVLHEINLVIKDVVRSESIDNEPISTMVIFFSNSEYWRQQLLHWGKEHNVTRFLSKNVETRWYSFILMSMAAKSHEKGIEHCLDMFENEPKKHPRIPEKVIEAIRKPGIFRHIGWIISVLKPMSDLIARLESQTANLGDVWPCLLELNRLYKTFNTATLPAVFMDIVKLIRDRLNFRAQKFDKSVYIIALYLSPSYRLIATSKKYTMKKIHRMIVADMRACKMIKTKKEGEKVTKALIDYHNNVLPYHAKEKNAIKFWKSLSPTHITKYAIEVLSLIPSSANIERLFSKMSRTKTCYRNKMKVETNTNIGQIKLDLLNEKAKDTEVKEDDAEFPYYPIDMETNDDDDELLEESVIDGFIDLIFDTSLPIFEEDSEEADEDNEDWDDNELFSSDGEDDKE